MFEKAKDDLELESLLKSQRPELLKMFETNFKTLTETLKVILSGKTIADVNKMESAGVFWNAAGFINMSSYDLKVIVKEMTFATDDWTKKYFARQACHLMYELTNDLFKILGKDFKIQIEKLADNECLKASIIDIQTKLNSFKDDNSARLKEIRNVSAAHRDKNFIVQLRLIESINWIDTISIAKCLSPLMFGHFFQKGLLLSGHFVKCFPC